MNLYDLTEFKCPSLFIDYKYSHNFSKWTLFTNNSQIFSYLFKRSSLFIPWKSVHADLWTPKILYRKSKFKQFSPIFTNSLIFVLYSLYCIFFIIWHKIYAAVTNSNKYWIYFSVTSIFTVTKDCSLESGEKVYKTTVFIFTSSHYLHCWT